MPENLCEGTWYRFAAARGPVLLCAAMPLAWSGPATAQAASDTGVIYLGNQPKATVESESGFMDFLSSPPVAAGMGVGIAAAVIVTLLAQRDRKRRADTSGTPQSPTDLGASGSPRSSPATPAQCGRIEPRGTVPARSTFAFAPRAAHHPRHDGHTMATNAGVAHLADGEDLLDTQDISQAAAAAAALVLDVAQAPDQPAQAEPSIQEESPVQEAADLVCTFTEPTQDPVADEVVLVEEEDKRPPCDAVVEAERSDPPADPEPERDDPSGGNDDDNSND